jgi:hypothetical protein
MKKCAFVAILLAMSTAAFAMPKIEVKATPSCPLTCECVQLMLCGCAPGNYEICDMSMDVSCGGRILILDVYMRTKCGTNLDQPFAACYTLGTMCPGTYMVFVKLHLQDSYCRCSETAAMASTVFTVSKQDSGWPWSMFGLGM